MTKPVDICFACGARLPLIDGPTHRYMKSAPACWNAYNEILAREFQDLAYFSVHQLSVDAYAVQHPGDPNDRRAVQSVNIHLTSLYLIFELNRDYQAARYALKKLAEEFKKEFRPLSPPAAYAMTVEDVLPARTAADHRRLVGDWARAAWNGWSEHHAIAADWARRIEM